SMSPVAGAPVGRTSFAGLVPTWNQTCSETPPVATMSNVTVTTLRADVDVSVTPSGASERPEPEGDAMLNVMLGMTFPALSYATKVPTGPEQLPLSKELAFGTNLML